MLLLYYNIVLELCYYFYVNIATDFV